MSEAMDESNDCPSCGQSETKKISEVPSPICTNCGFVVGSGVTVSSPSKQNEDGSTKTLESWEDHYSISNSTEKQIALALHELETIDDELDLSRDIREQGAEVYANAAIEKLTDGRATERIVAAAICIASREVDSPITIAIVADVVDFETAKLKRTVRLFQQELDRGFPGQSPTKYVPRIADEVGLNAEITESARQLIEQYEERERTTGLNPAGVAGAAIYVVAEETVTQREIARVVGVSKETIRIRVRELREVVLQ